MLKRKIMRRFERWKEASDHKCLIVRGARQVGKTYSIREFGKRFASFIEINFIERPELKEIFSGNLDTDRLMATIRLYIPEVKIVPGDTVIFLDEIQECEEALTSLKFLAQDDRIKVICSGSALGMTYKPKTSYPVGSVEYAQMTSLDFEEFLWALGIDDSLLSDISKRVEEKRFDQKIPGAINKKLMDYLREYMVIGGMPEVVQRFVDTGDYYLADQIQRRLYTDYINDIARYAEPFIKIKAEKCFRSIPLQLNKSNHKFQYSKVEHGGNKTKFGSSIDWLVNADIVIPVYSVSTLEYPLKAFADEDNFRLYTHDIGLMISSYGFELKAALLGDKSVEEAPGDIILGTAKGGLYEALVAEMLHKAGYKDLYFFRNKSGSIEMEFLIEGEGGVTPIEVKAGRNRTRSLNTILQGEKIRLGYKLASQNVGITGKKVTMPIYMAAFLANFRQGPCSEDYNMI